jgi:small-conductance mechanosensitive channel
MSDWSLSPEIVVPLLRNIGGAVLLVVFVYLGYRLLRRTIAALERRELLSSQMALLVRRALDWGALILAVVVVLQWFGLLKDFWTFLSTVLALVAIGFVAVWSVLSNVLCSVVLMLARPFQVGDTIGLPAQDLEGEVVDFTLLFTTLRDSEGGLIQIPNNTFLQTPLRRKRGRQAVSLEEQLGRTENSR